MNKCMKLEDNAGDKASSIPRQHLTAAMLFAKNRARGNAHLRLRRHCCENIEIETYVHQYIHLCILIISTYCLSISTSLYT